MAGESEAGPMVATIFVRRGMAPRLGVEDEVVGHAGSDAL
jgi:hypothetical protein